MNPNEIMETLNEINAIYLQNRQNVFNANHRRIMLEKYGYTEAMNLWVNPRNPYELQRGL